MILYHTYNTVLRHFPGTVTEMALHTKTDSDGNPNVFKVKRNDDTPWLNSNWANPDNHWNLDNEFVFRLRKYLSLLSLAGMFFLLKNF